jgi:hypothetical protein
MEYNMIQRLIAALAVIFYAATAQAAYNRPPGPIDFGSYTYAQISAFTGTAKRAGRSVYCSDCLKTSYGPGQSLVGGWVISDGTNWFGTTAPMANPSPTATTRLVATHTQIQDTWDATNKSLMARNSHVMRSDISSFQVVFSSCMTGVAEAMPSATATIKADVEFPDGVFTPILFSASATGTIPITGAQLLVSDAVSLTIKAGQRFRIRSYLNSTAGICYYTGVDSVNGDGSEMSTTINGATDKTASGTVSTATTLGYSPIAIIGSSTKEAVCLHGDSRVAQNNDVHYLGQASDAGTMPRALGPYYAYTSMALAGEKASDFIAGHTIRLAIDAYCTRIHNEYGINDLTGGATAAALLASDATIAGYTNIAGKPITAKTLEPVSTSTDAWATVANQTTAASNGPRVTFNNNIRGNGFTPPTWMSAYFEYADQVESSRDSGKWKANGYPGTNLDVTQQGFTSDGVHLSTLGITSVRDSGAIWLGAFGWTAPNIAPGSIQSWMLGPDAQSQTNIDGPVPASIIVGNMTSPTFNTQATVSAASFPILQLTGTGNAANLKHWQFLEDTSGCLIMRPINDALTVATNGFSACRNTSEQVTQWVLTGSRFDYVSGTIYPAAGTTTYPPFQLTAGTNQTTPTAGALEYDGTAFYNSHAVSERGVMPSEQIQVLSANFNLTSTTSAQKLLNASTNGALTVSVGTYTFECTFALASLSATSGSFGFSLAGTKTSTEAWEAIATKGAANATATASNSTWNTGANTTLVTANTSTTGNAHIKGHVRVTGAGTIIPSVSLTVAAVAVVQSGSYCKFSPIGSGTVTTVGQWG